MMQDSLLRHMLMEWSCVKAMHRYTAAVDGDDIDLFLDAFTPDGVWERDGTILRGHEELRDFYLGRPRGDFSRHLMSNIRVEVLDQEHARAISSAIVFKAARPASLPLKTLPQTLLSHYEDKLRCCADGQWRIARRRVTIDLDTLQS